MPRPLTKTDAKTCLFCEKKFKRAKYGISWEDLTRWKNRKFCSRSCAESKKNPTDRTTYHQRARKHRKTECEVCGLPSRVATMEGHHKDGNRANNRKSNSTTLCRSCHQSVHQLHRNSGRIGKKLARKVRGSSSGTFFLWVLKDLSSMLKQNTGSSQPSRNRKH